MILASGPNVFKGYLQKDVKTPFFESNGITWYVTGDIGYCTQNGSLVITGRLKRFIKIGGEMISLGAIEAALMEGESQGEGLQLALCAKEEKEAGLGSFFFPQKNVFSCRSTRICVKKVFLILSVLIASCFLMKFP